MPASPARRRRTYIDIDPGYTQFWHAAGNTGARLEGHDFYFTIGQNIGSDICPIPTCGIRWRHVRPPVLMDLWPCRVGVPAHQIATDQDARFTRPTAAGSATAPHITWPAASRRSCRTRTFGRIFPPGKD
jgi:hypothetical protein